jgi:glycerol-3-phosphate dehydrogenase
LAWCARNEAIVHLDDLLLRRTRVGLLGANGGLVDIPRLHALAQKELGWDEDRWLSELERYQSLHSRYYALPAA